MRGDRRKTSIEWPAAVDDRLRHLVRLAEEAADMRSTSAAELLAALIWAQPLDGAGLAATIAAYRHGRENLEAISSSDLTSRPRRRGRPRRSKIKDNHRGAAAPNDHAE
jgi:hypothetical protein